MIRIESRSIGPAEPVWVIAEIGVNHDGSLDRALELVAHAKNAGADAVKLQVFSGEALMHPCALFAEYQKDRVQAADPVQMLKQYELTDAEMRRVVEAIREAGMSPLATPFSLGDVDRIVALDIRALKIASPDLVNRLLLERCLTTAMPLILSTGAATLSEIDRSTEWLDERSARYALLHCISSYPTEACDANLSWIARLGQRYSVPIGFSDHTTDAISGALAVMAGACIVEKHLTYDTAARGPDHSASMDPVQFAKYVQDIRRAEILRGSGDRRVLDCERDVRSVSRQSFVAARDIPEGETISRADLITQRPAVGILAGDLDRVLNSRSTRFIKAGTMLLPCMLESLR